jgi:hypothetical protein
MKQLTPEQKHSILTHYSARRKGETLEKVLALHDVKASRRAVELWQKQWDGTIASLQHKPVPGRPHVLTPAEVQRHIAAPIRRKNRSTQRVRYTDLVESIQHKTGKQVSPRTIQRIGKNELRGRKTRGKKRTADECEYTNA